MINGQKRSLVKKTFEDILPDCISKGNKSTNPTIPNAEERFYLSIEEEQLLKDTPLKKYMNSSYKHYGKVILPHQLSYFLELNSKAFQ